MPRCSAYPELACNGATQSSEACAQRLHAHRGRLPCLRMHMHTCTHARMPGARPPTARRLPPCRPRPAPPRYTTTANIAGFLAGLFFTMTAHDFASRAVSSLGGLGGGGIAGQAIRHGAPWRPGCGAHTCMAATAGAHLGQRWACAAGDGAPYAWPPAATAAP